MWAWLSNVDDDNVAHDDGHGHGDDDDGHGDDGHNSEPIRG